MKRLWLSCPDGLMSEEDILKSLHDLTGIDFKKKLQDWVHTTKELPVSELLSDMGVAIKHEPAQWAQKLGLRIAETHPSGVVIKQVLNESISQKAGLCDGDEWIGVEVITKKSDPHHLTWRIHKLDDIQLYVGSHRYINAIISRDKRILSIKMDLKELQDVKTLRLISTESDRLKSWLTHQS
jgi:predicted metalloprotease with PDZ domain